MACWTLWQRLPPRYQLTTKEIYEEAEPIPSSPRSPRPQSSPRVKTPRPFSSPRVKTPRPCSSPRVKTPRSPSRAKQDTPRNKGQATMYFTVSSEETHSARDRTHNPQLAFPARRSVHIDNFKQQQRINSARQNFPDPSTTTPRSNTPSLRARTAPQFPVTRMSSYETCCPKHAPPKEEERPKAAPHVKRRAQSKSAGVIRQNQQLSVNTILPFEQKPLVKSPLYADKNTKRYYVRNLDNATMVIDDDKIVFIKRSSSKMGNGRLRPDTAEDMSYLAHLRKLYLREPKDMVKLSKQSPQDKKTLIRERLEYDKKTDRILNYYSREDDIKYASAWTSAVEASRGQSGLETNPTPRSARVHSSRESRRRGPSSPPRSAGRTRPASARIDPTVSVDKSHPTPDILADWNMFLRINSQSILHDRKFYLQTPAFGANGSMAENEDESKDCSCRMCKIEQEVALFRQQHPDAVIVLSEPQIEYETEKLQPNDTSKSFGGSSQTGPSYKLNYADTHTKEKENVRAEADINEKAILAVASATKERSPDKEHAKKSSSETLNLCIDLSTGNILSPVPIDPFALKDHQDDKTKSSTKTEAMVGPVNNTSNKNTQTEHHSDINGLSCTKSVDEVNSSPKTERFVSQNSTSDVNDCIDRASPNTGKKCEEIGLVAGESEKTDGSLEKPVENYQVFNLNERGQSDVNVTTPIAPDYSRDVCPHSQSERAGILGNDDTDNIEE